MKKFLAITASALLMLSFAPDADAQLLKMLGDAARSAAGNAARDAGRTPDNRQSSNGDVVTTHATYAEGTDPFIEYVDNLFSSEELSNYREYSPEVGEVQPKEFASISEAVRAYPKLPTVAQLVSGDPAPARTYAEFSGTAYRLLEKTTLGSIGAFKTEAAAAGMHKATPAQMAQVQGTAMEMFLLMQKYGIDPEKMSEADMMEFMRKMAVSGELKLPDGVSASDIVVEEESEDDKLAARIDALVEKVNDLVIGNTMLASAVNPAIKSVFDEIRASWKDSDSYRKVYEIEKDIDGRALEYFKAHSYSDAIDYPPFWVEGRKKENALIDNFNRTNADKWLKVLQAEIDKYLPLLEELAVLDAEVDALYPDKRSSDNLMYKNNLGQAFSGLSTLVDAVLNKAYAMPLVGYVAESDTYAMGM